MKKRWRRTGLILLGVSVGAMMFSCQKHADRDETSVTAKSRGVQTAELRVQGTDCASCDVTIRRHLRKLSGVLEIRAGDDKQHVLVDFDPTRISPEQIASAVLTAGYEAEIFVHPTTS